MSSDAAALPPLVPDRLAERSASATTASSSASSSSAAVSASTYRPGGLVPSHSSSGLADLDSRSVGSGANPDSGASSSFTKTQAQQSSSQLPPAPPRRVSSSNNLSRANVHSSGSSSSAIAADNAGANKDTRYSGYGSNNNDIDADDDDDSDLKSSRMFLLNTSKSSSTRTTTTKIGNNNNFDQPIEMTPLLASAPNKKDDTANSSGRKVTSKSVTVKDSHNPYSAAAPDGASASALEPSAASVLMRDIAVGLINMVLAIPALYGYTALVFGHPVFVPVQSHFARLFLFSSFVHQMLVLRSALPFAIGQVQDAGLIFLSVMATGIANELADAPPPVVWATTAVCLSLSTAALGVVLVVLARCSLAKFVSYLPTPVIAGYLAFIGYFCLQAGVALCTALPFASPRDWLTVIGSSHITALALPGLVSGGILSVVARKLKHPMALPLTMLLLPALFFTLLYITGTSLAESRAAGWVSPLAASAAVTDVLALFDLSIVRWDVMPSQIPRWAAMTVIVAFSSCLDVAAVEIDLGRPLNVNAELEVIGWANTVSGLLAGFPGSYIFSQTIFTCRAGSRSRLVGGILAAAELAVFVLPVDVMALLPRFFFAATLIFIAYDLMLEWLYEVYALRKVTAQEHAVSLITFVSLLVFGVEQGLLVGVAVAALQFVVGYARSAQVAPSWPHSSAATAIISSANYHLANSAATAASALAANGVSQTGGHNYALASISASASASGDVAAARRLTARAGQTCVLSLSGYVFFGSAQILLEEAFAHVYVLVSERNSNSGSSGSGHSTVKAGRAALASLKYLEHRRAQRGGGGAAGATHVKPTSIPASTAPVAVAAPRAALGASAEQESGPVTALLPSSSFGSNANSGSGSGAESVVFDAASAVAGVATGCGAASGYGAASDGSPASSVRSYSVANNANDSGNANSGNAALNTSVTGGGLALRRTPSLLVDSIAALGAPTVTGVTGTTGSADALLPTVAPGAGAAAPTVTCSPGTAHVGLVQAVSVAAYHHYSRNSNSDADAHDYSYSEDYAGADANNAGLVVALPSVEMPRPHTHFGDASSSAFVAAVPTVPAVDRTFTPLPAAAQGSAGSSVGRGGGGGSGGGSQAGSRPQTPNSAGARARSLLSQTAPRFGTTGSSGSSRGLDLGHGHASSAALLQSQTQLLSQQQSLSASQLQRAGSVDLVLLPSNSTVPAAHMHYASPHALPHACAVDAVPSVFVPALARVVRPTAAVVIDFARVLGVDATAVRACFRALTAVARGYGVDVVFAHMPADVSTLLRNNGVLPPLDNGDVTHNTVDDCDINDELAGLVPGPLLALARQCSEPVTASAGTVAVAPTVDAALAWCEAREFVDVVA